MWKFWKHGWDFGKKDCLESGSGRHKWSSLDGRFSTELEFERRFVATSELLAGDYDFVVVGAYARPNRCTARGKGLVCSALVFTLFFV